MGEVRISKHAQAQMDERGIPEKMVLEILEQPDQTIPEDEGKLIHQSIKYFREEDKDFLVRVFVNIVKQPNLVITVYRTSKIEKYWKNED
jgi:hypothetical protein